MIIKSIFREFNRIHYAICFAATIILFVAAVLFIKDTNKAKVYNLDFSSMSEDVADDGSKHLYVYGISLRKGTYDLAIGYVSDIASSITIALDNDTIRSEELAPAPKGNVVSYDFELKSGTDRGKIDLNCPAGGDLRLVSVMVASDKPLNYDRLIIGVLMLLMIPCAWLGMFFFTRSTHKIPLVIAMIIVIIQILPLIMNTGLNLGIDTRAHMMRIEGIFYGLLDGQFPVIIYPEWNNSYGQIGVLYPNVFLYIPALFRLFGMSQLGACKLFLFLVIFASAAIALASARSIFRRDWQITIAVTVICLDNMRLLDMLGDGRIGGALLAEMFYPLVIAGLIEVFYRNKHKWYLLAYGIAGVACCHVMSATLVCLSVLLFLILSIRKLSDPKIRRAIVYAMGLFCGLVFGTAVLFLKYYFSDWGQDKLQWEDFVATLWPRGALYDDSKWIYVIALLLICAFSVTVLLIRKRGDLIRTTFFVPAFVCAAVLFVMSTVAFPWAILRRIRAVEYYTNMLQDSYRFLSLAACFLAFCIPCVLETVVMSIEGRRSYKSRTTIAACVLIAVLCSVNFLMINHEFFRSKNHTLYYDAVIGRTEYQMEDYLPSGTQSEWYKTDAGTISDEDAVKSLAYEREGTYVYYSYTNSKEGAYVEFPRFYYDGYVAENQMAEDVPVYKGDRNRTRVYLEVTDTPAVIRMWYHVPWYLTLAASLSFGLWIGSIMILGVRIIGRVE